MRLRSDEERGLGKPDNEMAVGQDLRMERGVIICRQLGAIHCAQ